MSGFLNSERNHINGTPPAPHGLNVWWKRVGLLGLFLVLGVHALVAAEPMPVTAPAAPPATWNLDRVDEIYIPADLLDAVLKQDGESALMSREEYEKLLQEARARAATNGQQNLTPLLGAAEYRAAIHGGRITVTATFQVKSSQPASELLIENGYWNVHSARVNGETANVARGPEDQNQLRLFLPAAGEHRFELELSNATQSTGSDQLVQFPLFGETSGEFKLTLPAGKSLLLNGRSLTRPAELSEPAEYTIATGGLKHLSLTVTDRTQATRSDSLTFASTAYGLKLLPGEVSWSTVTTLQVYGRKIDQLVCHVPQALEITGVQSEGLESWVLDDDASHPEETRLTLKFRIPFDGQRKFQVQGLLSPALGHPWSAPQLKLDEITAQTGTLAIWLPEQLRLQTLEQTHVRGIAAPDVLKSPADGPPALCYELWRDDFVLAFQTALKESPLQAAMTNVLLIKESGLELLSAVTLQARRNPLFEVRLRLPTEYRVTRVELTGGTSDWETIPADPGLQDVRIRFATPIPPGQTVTLNLAAEMEPENWPVQSQPVSIPLPAVKLLQSGMVELLYGICAPDMLQVTPVEITGLDPAEKGEMTSLSERLQSTGQTLRLGYSAQELNSQGQLQISRQPGSLTVETVSLFRVDRETVSTLIESRLSVSGGGLRTVQLQLAERAGNQVRFVLRPASEQSAPAQLMEQVAGEPIGGFRPWMLSCDRPLQGDYLLHALVVLPRGTAEEWSPVEVRFPQSISQSGFIAIAGTEEEQVKIVESGADGKPLQEVDPIDFPVSWGSERLVAGYRYAQPDWTVKASLVPFSRGAIPSAVAHQFQLATVWNDGADVQFQGDLTFHAIGMQSLTLVLPENSRLWSVLLDDQPVETRQGADGVRIPLSQLDPETQHRLSCLYDAPVSRDRTLQLIPPEFRVTTGAGIEQSLPVLEQSWSVHYPDALQVLNASAPYRLEPASQVRSWPEQIQHLIGSLTLWHLLTGIAVLVLILFGVLVLQWLVLLCKTGSGAAGVLLVVVLLVGGAFLMLPAVQQSREAARRSSVKHRLEQTHQNSLQDGIMLSDKPVAAFDLEESTARLTIPAAEPAPATAPSPKPDEMKTPVSQAVPPPAAAPAETPVPIIVKENADQSGPVPSYAPVAAKRKTVAQLGKLSLAAALQIPENTRQLTVTYQGNRSPGKDLPLNLTVADRTETHLLQLAIALGIGLLGWRQRHGTPAQITIWLFLTVVVPLTLLAFVTGWWALWVIGILWGGLCTVGLWSLILVGKLFTRGRDGFWRCVSPRSAWPLIMIGLLWNAPVSSAAEPAADAPVPATGETGAPSVYVPYQSLSQISSADRVYVPPALFKTLWMAGHPSESAQATPSVPALIAEAIYRAELVKTDVGNRLEITARWIAVNQTDIPQSIPLPIMGAALESVQASDSSATVLAGTDGVQRLLLPGRGVHLVDAKFTLPMDATADAGQFRLEFRPVGSGLLNVILPKAEEARRLRVNGLSNLFESEVVESRQEIRIPIDRGGRYTVAWQPERQQQDQSALVQLQGTLRVQVSDVGLDHYQHYQLTVREGGIGECRFGLPDGLQIRQVTGNDVAGWEVEPGPEGGQQLKVLLRRQVSNETVIQMQLFQGVNSNDPVQKFSLKTLQPLGMNREAGQIAIRSPEELRLTATDVTGLQQIDSQTLVPDSNMPKFRNSTAMAWKYSARPFTCDLQLERRTGEVRGIVEQGLRIGLRKISVATHVQLQVMETPRRQFEITLPEGYQPLNVTCAGSSDWFVTQNNGSRRLIVELSEPRTGLVEISLEGQFSREQTPQAMELGTPAPVVSSLTTTLGIWLDSAEQGSVVETGNWISISPEQLAESIRKLSPLPVQFAFQSRDVPSAIRLALQKTLPELQADAGVLIAVGDATVDYGFTLRWKISQSAADTFAVMTPNWIGQLEFRGEGIRQIRSEAGEQGQTRWIITSLEPLREEFLLTAAATVALPVDQMVQTPQLRFLSMTGPNPHADLARQQQFAVLVNLSSNQLSPSGTGSQESVAVEDLPLRLPPRLVQQAMSILRVRDGSLPAWKIVRPERIESARAIILSAALTTVLQPDGSWRTKAVYGVRNRGQQFLAVTLPEQSEILSVLVRGQPSRTVLPPDVDAQVQLIPLPQTSAADLSFDVTLVLSGKLPRPLPSSLSLFGRNLSLPAPNILSPKESAEFGVSTAQTVWNVYVPDGLTAVPVTRSGATNLTWHRGSGWLEAEMQMLNRYRSDLSELSRILSSSDSSVLQRDQARTNLKQLQSQLESQQNFIPSDRDWDSDGVAQQFSNENRRLQEEVAESSRRESGSRPAVQEKSKSEVGNRAYIIQSNELLLNFNGNADSKQEAGSSPLGFRFATEAVQTKSGAKGSEAQERSQLRSQLSRQVPLESQNSNNGFSFREQSFWEQPGPQGTGDRMGAGTRFRIESEDVRQNEVPTLDRIPDLSRPLGYRVPASGSGIQWESEQLRFGGSSISGSAEINAAPTGIPTPQWTSTGSLSVPVSLPVSGHEMAFSRVGGNPELTLTVYGAGWRGWGKSVLWGVLWLGIGLAMVRFRGVASARKTSLETGLMLVLVVSGVLFVILQGELRWEAFVFFCGVGLTTLLATACCHDEQHSRA